MGPSHPMNFNGMKSFLIIKLTMKLCEGNMVMDQLISFQNQTKMSVRRCTSFLKPNTPLKFACVNIVS